MAVKLYFSRIDDSLYDTHDTGPWGVQNFYWQQLVATVPSVNYMGHEWISGFEDYPLNFWIYNTDPYGPNDKSFFRCPGSDFWDMVIAEGFTRIPAATWQFKVYIQMGGGPWTTGSFYILMEVYKRNAAGDSTLLFTSNSPTVSPGGGLQPEWTAEQAAFDFESTDQIVIKAYCYDTVSNIIQFRVGTGQESYFELLDMSDEPPKMGPLVLAANWKIGNIVLRDRGFTAECRSHSQHLSQQVLELYSPTCRARLGDSRCTVDLEDSAGTYRHEGAVTSVTEDRRKFIDTSITGITEDVFRYGLVTWTEPESGDTFPGNNGGYTMEVKSYDPVTKEIELFDAMPYDIEIDDEYSMTYGCDKSAATCKDRFANLINFRGEPYIPGNDIIKVEQREHLWQFYFGT